MMHFEIEKNYLGQQSWDTTSKVKRLMSHDDTQLLCNNSSCDLDWKREKESCCETVHSSQRQQTIPK